MKDWESLHIGCRWPEVIKSPIQVGCTSQWWTGETGQWMICQAVDVPDENEKQNGRSNPKASIRLIYGHENIFRFLANEKATTNTADGRCPGILKDWLYRLWIRYNIAAVDQAEFMESMKHTE